MSEQRTPQSFTARRVVPLGWAAATLALVITSLLVASMPVLAVPFGWDTDWGNPEAVGTKAPGTPPPVAEPATTGIIAHWVVRGEAGSSEFFIQTRKLPGDETTSVEAGGKVLGLSACSTPEGQYVGWSAYDGQQYWLVLSRLREDPLEAAGVVRRSVPHPVGSMALACTQRSVIVAWEEYGTASPGISFTAVGTGTLDDFASVQTVDARHLLAEELGTDPGTLRSPVVLAGDNSAGLVWFEQLYTEAGHLWYADLGRLLRSDLPAKGTPGTGVFPLTPLLDLFSPGPAEGPSYRLLPGSGGGPGMLVAVGALPDTDYSGLFVIPLGTARNGSPPGAAVPIARLNYQEVYGLSALSTEDYLWAAWVEDAPAPTGSTIRGTRLPASEVADWTFGRSGAWNPLLVDDHSGGVHLLWTELGSQPNIYYSQYGAPVHVTRWNLVGATETDPLGSLLYRLVELVVLAAAQTLLNFPVALVAAGIAYAVGSRLTELRVGWLVALAASIVALALFLHLLLGQPAAMPVPGTVGRSVHVLVSGGLLTLFGLRYRLTRDFFSLATASTLFLWWTTLFGMLRMVYPS